MEEDDLDLDVELLAVAGRKAKEGISSIPWKKRMSMPTESERGERGIGPAREDADAIASSPRREGSRHVEVGSDGIHVPDGNGRLGTRSTSPSEEIVDSHASDASSTFDDGYDEDLYADEEDRARLAGLPELEREMILYERGEERERKLEAWNALRTAKERSFVPSASSKRDRSVKHTKERTALDHLVREKKRRILKSTKKGSRAVPAKKRIRASDFDASSDEEEEHEDEEYPGTSESEEGHDEGRPLEGTSFPRRRGEDYEDHLVTEITYSDAKKMQVTRHQLDKWLEYPVFEALIPRCLVRFPEAQREGIKYYAVGEVARVQLKEDRKSYEMPESKKRTSKYLVVRSGTSEKVLALSTVSNSPFQPQEFDAFLHRLEVQGVPVPTLAVRDVVVENIQKAEGFRYTSEDIARLVEEKRKAKRIPGNIGVERARLVSKRNHALQNGREEDARAYQERIDELEALQDRMRKESSRGTGLADINRRNARINFLNQLHGVSNTGGAGTQGMGSTVDPFSRRQTRPRTHGKASRNEETEGGTPTPVPSHGTKGMVEDEKDPWENFRIELASLPPHKPEAEVASVVRQLLGDARHDPPFGLYVAPLDLPRTAVLKFEEYHRHMNM